MKLHEILTDGRVSKEGLLRLQNIQEEIDSYKKTIKELEGAFAISNKEVHRTGNNTWHYEPRRYTKEEFKDASINNLIGTIKEEHHHHKLLEGKVESFNSLPWYRRMFRKV